MGTLSISFSCWMRSGMVKGTKVGSKSMASGSAILRGGEKSMLIWAVKQRLLYKAL